MRAICESSFQTVGAWASDHTICVNRSGRSSPRFFNKLECFRAVATRYDKLARDFLAAFALAATMQWRRHGKSTTCPRSADAK